MTRPTRRRGRTGRPRRLGGPGAGSPPPAPGGWPEEARGGARRKLAARRVRGASACEGAAARCCGAGVARTAARSAFGSAWKRESSIVARQAAGPPAPRVWLGCARERRESSGSNARGAWLQWAVARVAGRASAAVVPSRKQSAAALRHLLAAHVGPRRRRGGRERRGLASHAAQPSAAPRRRRRACAPSLPATPPCAPADASSPALRSALPAGRLRRSRSRPAAPSAHRRRGAQRTCAPLLRAASRITLSPSLRRSARPAAGVCPCACRGECGARGSDGDCSAGRVRR